MHVPPIGIPDFKTTTFKAFIKRNVTPDSTIYTDGVPVGELVPLALKAVSKGGRVVCAGIHMSDIPSFPYSLLWEERQLVSVANLTRQDGIDFLRVTAEIGIVAETTRYPLNQANQALADLRAGIFEGAAVLVT